MVKNCVYCKTNVDENAALDVCDRCGRGVWGDKMFSAIKQGCENAKSTGDLYQGSISDPKSFKQSTRKSVSFTQPEKSPSFAEG